VGAGAMPATKVIGARAPAPIAWSAWTGCLRCLT
jgi:hypothetical protein